MIQNLDLKLEGKKPVSREELFELVSSWGRNRFFTTDDNIYVDECAPKECYDLSNLDVSNVKNFSFLFYNSMFNGDINKWNVSNSNSFVYMFSKSYFNGDISNWNFNENSNCDGIFYVAEAFKKKYNDGEEIPFDNNKFLKWFEENRNKIASLNISKEEISNIDDYLETFNLEKRSIDLNKY